MTLSLLESCLTILGSIGALYSGISWILHRRREHILDQPVSIILTHSESGRPFHSLAAHPARRNVTRAEVLGLVGMVPTKNGKRFTCSHLATQIFVDDLDRIFDGESDKLVIPFTYEESSDFTVESKAHQAEATP